MSQSLSILTSGSSQLDNVLGRYRHLKAMLIFNLRGHSITYLSFFKIPTSNIVPILRPIKRIQVPS